ncbi:hypothetical protein BLS_008278 [Venturia inaequalis]|uniref:Integral membrane protein n=1 Tax=Venturia inaequalis TaxID=5025 RepID=A0A8H3U7C9_VENIN|nr:hypothetical protein BLS_008278 [Venturia inaequalis]
MPQKHSSLLHSALLLGLPLAIASPHGSNGSGHSEMGAMDMSMAHSSSSPSNSTIDPGPMSYFRLGEKTAWIYGHIFVMTICWTVVLPLSIMLSIAKSRFTIPSQATFLVLNALGLFLGTVYNANTPDLYANNAHHKMGWIFTWLALAWTIMGIVNIYGKYVTDRRQSREQISQANLARYARLHQDAETQDVRWSNDSGQGTERNSASLFGPPSTESENRNFDNSLQDYNDVDLDEVLGEAEKHGFLRNTRVDRFLSQNIHRIAFGKTLIINRILYTIIERTIILMGWAALATGIITFGGIFRGSAVFNGLAHWIKGGVFFWYGIYTLGRWMGAFADFGWAWNIKPRSDLIPTWKTRIPSADSVESFLIFLYGISNVWLEHLAAWGSTWSPEDYEHVSITILFFGGGLLGMLIESSRIRDLLSTNILLSHKEQEEQAPHTITTAQDTAWNQPTHYTISLNPLPALVILLLGLMMSSHTQDSPLSSMIHKQWGSLLIGASLARGTTYILCYLKPQSSHLPARPPSELICAFCLMAGGVVFMASARDVVMAMEYNGLDAMFGFTLETPKDEREVKNQEINIRTCDKSEFMGLTLLLSELKEQSASVIPAQNAASVSMVLESEAEQ